MSASSSEFRTSAPGQGTFDHEKELPSLPVAPLEDTLERYLKSVKPFLSESELEHTTAVVHEFQNGIGKELQKQLEERAADPDQRNWLEDWWETLAYMQSRIPIAVNINYYGVLPGLYWGRLSNAELASFFVQGVLQFHHQIATETLPVETMRKQKLCMHQYRRMFHTCRVPGEFQDEFALYPRSKHIMVLRNNFMFTFDVLDDNYNTLPIEHIHLQFQRVLDEADSMFDLGRESQEPLSVLTGDDRTSWAKARDHLIEISPVNKENLESIQSALFCVSMDSGKPRNYEEVANACLCGDGRNKWYDKPFHVVIFDNGVCGCNGEHAWADAIVVVNMMACAIESCNAGVKEFSLKVMKSKNAAKEKTSGGLRALRKSMFYELSSSLDQTRIPFPKKLKWKVDTDTLQAIAHASATVGKLIEKTDLRVLEFKHYGRDFMKRYRLIPDFYVQMALQLAYKRAFGKQVSTYETGHLRAFYHGRTETVRSCHEEAVAFVNAMDDPNLEDNQKFDALKNAVNAQLVLVRNAMTGNGVDRHLLGLRVLAAFSGKKPQPSIFSDPAFTRSGSWQLSTSNVSKNNSPFLGGFAPFDDSGLGACYSIRKNIINVSIVSAFYPLRDDKSKSTLFYHSLEKALLDMQDICLSRNVMYVSKAKM